MCISQKHAGERQCLVSTFFVFAVSRHSVFPLPNSHSFFFPATFQTESSFHPAPAQISVIYKRPELAGFRHHHPAVYNLGKKQALQCFIWSQYLLPHSSSEFFTSLSKFQKTKPSDRLVMEKQSWGRTRHRLKRLDTRKIFLRWGWRNTATGCPERWSMPHPWEHSGPGWMELWATWSGGRGPCPWQGGWTRRPLKVPSNPSHRMVLKHNPESYRSRQVGFSYREGWIIFLQPSLQLTLVMQEKCRNILFLVWEKDFTVTINSW